MFILKKGHQPGVYVPLRALFLVIKTIGIQEINQCTAYKIYYLQLKCHQTFKDFQTLHLELK